MGGLLRTWSHSQIAIVQEVTACQRSSKNCMEIPLFLRVTCESLTPVHYPWAMKCLVHPDIHTHTVSDCDATDKL